MIVMGDVCDGYPDVCQCIEELLTIKHCELVIGNHDMWALDWALKGEKPEIWTSQGGEQTMSSYKGCPMPKAHVDFLKGGHLWLEIGDQIFVHGGFNPDIALSSHSAQALVWDRELLDMAWKRSLAGRPCRFGRYKDIFVGHTTNELYRTLEPSHACTVWDLDTGAGWSGKLTIMDIDTKKYWQSDLSPDLYGGTPDRLKIVCEKSSPRKNGLTNED